MTDHHAGSATGIDLAALEQLARAVDAARTSPQEEDAYDELHAVLTSRTVLALIALARATPQHSVTEQASIGDDSKFQEFIAALVNNEYTNYMDFMASFISYLDARSQPLASTAATQPDQTSEREAFEAWAKSQGNRRGRKGDGYSTEYTQRAWLAWQARAALAIPASTAATQRHITVETAQAYMEESLWAFIECAGNYPSIKVDERIWPHVMAYAPKYTAATQPEQASTQLAELWIHEDMDRDATAAVLKMPRKELKRYYEQACADVLSWRRRALIAEAALAIPASTATGEQESEQADEVRPYTEAVAREAWGIVCNSRRGLTDAASAAIRDALLNPLWHASSPASTASNGEKA